MNAGLPTTGIGGIFYFFCVIVMFFFEVYKTFRGSSSFARWKFVLGQMLMLVVMLGMIWLTGVAISLFVPSEIRDVLTPVSSNSSLQGNTQTIFLTPFIILGCLLILTQGFRVYLVLQKNLKHI